MEKFKPEVLLASAGFDAHEEDELSDVLLGTEGYTWLMRTLVELAANHVRLLQPRSSVPIRKKFLSRKRRSFNYDQGRRFSIPLP
jgi:hypothetical protein